MKKQKRNEPCSTKTFVTRAAKAWIPELIAAASPEVTETYIDFLPATFRNRNTLAAYARALRAPEAETP